jgi:hypothetical protein
VQNESAYSFIASSWQNARYSGQHRDMPAHAASTWIHIPGKSRTNRADITQLHTVLPSTRAISPTGPSSSSLSTAPDDVVPTVATATSRPVSPQTRQTHTNAPSSSSDAVSRTKHEGALSPRKVLLDRHAQRRRAECEPVPGLDGKRTASEAEYERGFGTKRVRLRRGVDNEVLERRGRVARYVARAGGDDGDERRVGGGRLVEAGGERVSVSVREAGEARRSVHAPGAPRRRCRRC